MPTHVKLKFGSGANYWDKVTLVIRGSNSIIPVIYLNNRNTALDVYRQLSIAYFDEHKGPIDVDIDQTQYTMTQDVWHGVLSCLDQWFEDYFEHVEVG